MVLHTIEGYGFIKYNITESKYFINYVIIWINSVLYTVRLSVDTKIFLFNGEIYSTCKT